MESSNHSSSSPTVTFYPQTTTIFVMTTNTQDTTPSLSTSESKTKLLRTLAKEVNVIKKELEDQKQKTDGVAEWIKNTFRPGMEKMKGTFSLFICFLTF
jgi:trans-aconitate methyltransferase